MNVVFIPVIILLNLSFILAPRLVISNEPTLEKPFNFSNSPTFISGSLNELRQSTMKGNPTTFISSVQLYNNSGDIVAVGNLSTPLKKNFSSEATIKVKLTY